MTSLKMSSFEVKNLRVFSKKELKKLVRPFLVLFLLNFLIINWNNVSWIFNYRVISNTASKFIAFLDYRPIFVNAEDTISNLKKENSLEIPKIGVFAPLILANNSSLGYLEKELDRGVVIFPNSALPGEPGPTTILGHSAPLNWPKVNYDKIFSRINELQEKDEIILYFNNEKYTYYVDKKIFLEKGEEIPNNLKDEENSLLLISCWPPGKNIQRIIVKSILIKT